LVQAPFNLIDRRIYSSGWLQKLYDRGVEVHTRSAFLQGLMLMPFDEIPEKFKHWWPLFDNWHCWLRDNNISAAKACIDFVQSYQQISKVVVGVTNLQQLEELIQMNKKPLDVNWPSIECLDEGLINPSTWVSP
jgi:aryl-alcohol dehydrogenase-like predicted oxidoreductase